MSVFPWVRLSAICSSSWDLSHRLVGTSADHAPPRERACTEVPLQILLRPVTFCYCESRKRRCCSTKSENTTKLNKPGQEQRLKGASQHPTRINLHSAYDDSYFQKHHQCIADMLACWKTHVRKNWLLRLSSRNQSDRPIFLNHNRNGGRLAGMTMILGQLDCE